jgi:hypothetical protein
MIKEKVITNTLNPKTGLPYHWEITDAKNEKHEWKEFYTGPLVLEENEIEALCQKLLGVSLDKLLDVANEELLPVPSLKDVGASIVMHSTTPDLKTFDGDLDKVIKNVPPMDYTSYKEARSVYLAGEGDVVVGRIEPWQSSANLGNATAVKIPVIDYYYISHALLVLAEQHLVSPEKTIDQIVDFLKANPNAVIRLYALEKEMQIFLVWLKRIAGLKHLLMDANSPEVARDWNKKSILFPTVEDAMNLSSTIKSYSVQEILEEEAKFSLLRKKLGCIFPVFPGYTVVRESKDLEAFTQQLLDASSMLQARYGLKIGCFKASDSGDGARITLGVDLSDIRQLKELAEDAYKHGDAYILEPYLYYDKVDINGESIKISPSAHIRWGEVADGVTLQFTEGTSWKGNIFFDERTSTKYGVSKENYQTIVTCMESIRQAFGNKKLGLTIAGFDFAIGTIGGFFGDKKLIGIQDPNISFNGAECLRAFLEKTISEQNLTTDEPLYGVTRVFKPSKDCTVSALRGFVKSFEESGYYTEAIASVPERWGMIAVAHYNVELATAKLAELRNGLTKKGLIL